MSQYFRDWGSEECSYKLVVTEGFTWDLTAIEKLNKTPEECAATYGKLEKDREFEAVHIYEVIHGGTLRVLGKSKDGHFVLKTRLGEPEKEWFGWIPWTSANAGDALRGALDAQKNGSPVTQGLLAVVVGVFNFIGLGNQRLLPKGPYKTS